MRILIFILGLLFIGSINAQSSFYKLYSSNGFDIGKGIAEYSDSSFSDLLGLVLVGEVAHRWYY